MRDALPHLNAAFTTDSLTWVDAAFVGARHLVVYDIIPNRAEILSATDFRVASAMPKGALAARMAGLAGAGVLFTTGLSDAAAIAVADSRIFPVVIERRRSIHEIITRLQRLMQHDPPLWMCRVLRYGVPTHDSL